MGSKRCTPQQTISKLREAEVLLGKGQSITLACRKLGIADQTYYRWRKEYGGMRVSQARLPREEPDQGCGAGAGAAEGDPRAHARGSGEAPGGVSVGPVAGVHRPGRDDGDAQGRASGAPLGRRRLRGPCRARPQHCGPPDQGPQEPRAGAAAAGG
jgi:hypothetical protein